MSRRTVLLAGAGVLLGILIGLGIVLWIRGGLQGKPPGWVDLPEVGKAAPEIQLNGLDGQPGKLSGFRGKAMLVNFWATWCQPCKQEMPLIEKAHQKYADELAVIGVDYSEGPVVVKPFVEQLGVTFPIWMDTSGSVSTRYNVRGLPSTYFIDKDGVLKAVHLGPLDEKTLPQYLQMVGLKP